MMKGYLLTVQLFRCDTEQEAEVVLSGLVDEEEAKKYIVFITNVLIESKGFPDGYVRWDYQVTRMVDGEEEYVSGDAIMTRIENRKIVVDFVDCDLDENNIRFTTVEKDFIVDCIRAAYEEGSYKLDGQEEKYDELIHSVLRKLDCSGQLILVV